MTSGGAHTGAAAFICCGNHETAMLDAIHLFNLANGPLRILTRHWMCRGLRRAPFGGTQGLDRYCGRCDAATTNDGRAIAIRRG